uniref:Uncharacterized protein n=1 Tax=Parastrongyloides trichosuri TaxID=131310 RepID=A0A0N5A264_PARTI
MVNFQLITSILLCMAIFLVETRYIEKRDTDDFFIDRTPKWYKDPIKATIVKNSPKRRVFNAMRIVRSTNSFQENQPMIMVPFEEAEMDVGTAPPQIIPFEEPSHEFLKKISETSNNKINGDHFGSKNGSPKNLVSIDFEGPLVKKFFL